MKNFSLNIKGKILEVNHPMVMGILNVTPDSFYDGSRTYCNAEAVEKRVRQMLQEGVDIIDIGGCSTRPDAPTVEESQELERVRLGCEIVRQLSPEILISVDTFRAAVAEKAVGEWGADIVNDISAGLLDPNMIPTVAKLKAPYIMMHTRGTPQEMTSLTSYPRGVTVGVAEGLHARIVEATQAGISDIIIDPGFGFAKTPEQNYELMRELEELHRLLDMRPMLVGISRKSMIYKPLQITPSESLPATDALNFYSLTKGAAIMRVHDVAAARQVCFIHNMLS